MSDPGPVPDRWLKCPRKSSDLIVNKFLVFKTPLSEKFDDQVELMFRFPPSMLLNFCKMKKYKLGLWIDLTNTNRFYDKNMLEKEGIKYLKLNCRGHGETPSPEQVREFTNTCHHFISQHPLEIIGVHCTHGFNRSGFMVISYLVEKMDCDLEIAIQEFSQRRPPGIYKEDYLMELFRRYGEIEDALPAPPLPDWCIEGENDDQSDNEEPNPFDRFTNKNGNESGSSRSGGSQNRNHSRKKQRFPNKKPVFMAGVPGVEPYLEYPDFHLLQRNIQKMCRCRSAKDFPGCQPVSMDLNNIKLLAQKPYRVSWKADGTRYMMLIVERDKVYFFDRDNNVFKVNKLTFPMRNNYTQHITNTLLDGEMVIDKVDGKSIPRYLVYDIVCFDGKNVSEEPFHPKRMEYISEYIVNTRNDAMIKGVIHKAEEPFSVRCKHFWDITQAESLLSEKFAKTLAHEPDGLIFQPSKESYVAGRCDEVLKWKPLHMNSVDFRLKIERIGGVGIITRTAAFLYVGKADKPFGELKYTAALKHLDNKIVECKVENGKWVFMRERTDKSYPNSKSTAEAVMNSITSPVTKEYLIKYIKERGFVDDTEIMPPPQKRIRR